MNPLAFTLTKNQREVVLGWVGGLTGTEIAEIKRVSPQAIDSMTNAILKRLGVATSREACYLWGINEGREHEVRPD